MNEITTKKARLSNFELLRILAMFLIVLGHMTNYSVEVEVSHLEIKGVNQLLYLAIKSFMLPAVNIYVLVSGYFLCKIEFKWDKFIKLVIEVQAVSIIIYFFMAVIGVTPFNPISFLLSIFPTFTGHYWFITVYVVLFLLSPYLNIVIEILSKKQFLILIIILFTINSVWQYIYTMPLFSVNHGFGLFHFITLYFSAAYIRCHGFIFKDFSRKSYMWMYIIILFLNIIASWILPQVAAIFFDNSVYIMNGVYAKILSYNSPVMMIMAYSIFMAFKKSEFNSNIINKLSKYTLGIYLIHVHASVQTALFESDLIQNWIFPTNSPFFIVNLLSVTIILFVFLFIISIVLNKVIDIYSNAILGRLKNTTFKN